MKVSAARLKELEVALAAKDGADMMPLPVELLRGLVDDAHERRRYEERVEQVIPIAAGDEEWIGSEGETT